jgi:LmbE family N-acetylglucosaminyl deacetylase
MWTLRRYLRRLRGIVLQIADRIFHRHDGRALVRTTPTAFDSIEALTAAPVLIVGAHPDDEILGTGGLMGRLGDFHVATVTNGAPRNWWPGNFANPGEYAAARHKEAEAALALLGRDSSYASSFGVNDQEASCRIHFLVRRLLNLLSDGRFKHVITHTYEGGHPDHDATALAVHAACGLLACKGLPVPAVVEMTGYHKLHGEMRRGEFLPHPGAGPVQTVILDTAERERKKQMFACHASQGDVLAPFPLDKEQFRQAPAYDFSLAPHDGELSYESYGWDIDGRRWRMIADRALAAMKLPIVL